MRVAAPATEGKANKELLRFLKDSLGIPASHIRIVHGAASRRKLLEIDGLTTEEIRHKLATDSS